MRLRHGVSQLSLPFHAPPSTPTPLQVRAYLEDPLIYHGWQTGILPVRTSYEVLKVR